MEGDNLSQVKEGWIETVSGGRFYFNDIKPESINITDVAHALGNLCRYNGHTKEFYSVAEHSVLMAKWAEKNAHQFGWGPRDFLTVLLHDASEAYIGDMTRPLKAQFPMFKQLEETIHAAVAVRFGSEYPHPDWLKSLDTRILVDERPQVMGVSGNDWALDGIESLGVTVKFWGPGPATHAFLREYERFCAMMSVKKTA